MEHILKSRYGIGEKISESPFSLTYRGFFIGTDKPVVIKIYKRGTLNSALIRDMKQKVKTFSLISHQGIAKLIDGDYGWQGFYYVREHISGRSIAELLGGGEALGVERAVEITEQVLSALEEAHARGMVHGALKPANIFIDAQGLVRLTDFVIEGEIKESYPQKVEEISFNAKYASPEEVAGRSASALSDVFSLGLVLFEMATGRPALAETGLSGNIRKLKEPTLFSKTDLTGLPKHLAEIILKATSRDPLQRFTCAAEFRESLEQKGIAAQKTGREDYLQMYENIVVQYGGEEVDKESEAIQEIGNFRLRWSKEKHRNWILGAAVGISVVLGLLYAFFSGR